MKRFLQNDLLSVTLDDLGAEPLSVRRGSCEYLWQGQHPDFWKNHAPILFPICGRLQDQKYRFQNTEYAMGIHGFARHLPFVYEGGTNSEARFSLSANEETGAQYPFEFRLDMTYRLDGDTLHVEAEVRNLDSKTMPFAYGAHPGFNVPLEGRGSYEDYEIVFDEACSPDKLVFSSDSHLNTGRRLPFALKGSRSFSLHHHLFDDDAIFLTRMASSVTLRSEATARYVRLEYPEMDYLGFWKNPCTEAPFVCIEPWCGTPSFEGEIDDFGTTKADMFHLAPGATKRLQYTITFG